MITKPQFDPLLETVRQFLREHHDPKRPLLVGVSGGADSLSLFLILHQLELLLHVIHVDHGWRSESVQEAQILETLIRSYPGVTFHKRSLPPHKPQVNREAEARELRLEIFQALCKEFHCQAILLAHHADDLVETTFKRVMEGAHLDKLCGLRPVHRIQELEIWRPLLPIRKHTLIQWLKRQNICPFEDRTNGAAWCLRGVCRERLFPQLTRELGRSIQMPLVRLSRQSAELEQYLDSVTDSLHRCVRRGILGAYLEAQEALTWHILLKRHLIRRFCADQGLVLSTESLESAVTVFSERRCGTFSRQGQTLYVDRGRLFFSSLGDVKPVESISCEKGEYVIGPWRVVVQDRPFSQEAAGWRGLWNSMSWVGLPRNRYQLNYPVMGARYPTGPTLSRHLNKFGVPTFLRAKVPVIWNDGEVVAEFLTNELSAHVKGPNCLITQRASREGSKNMAPADMIFVGVGVSENGLRGGI